MENNELITKLKDIITPYVQDKEAFNNISGNTSFISDLKINSANIVDIVIDVEQAFKIEIDNESMEKMLTVGSAMDIIKNKTKLL
jgi:acyl carrier protein